jgi:hypothetical protein
MKGSVALSLSLDVLAISVLLIPDEKFRWISARPKAVIFGKRVGFLLLLLSGFLIDQYISHPGR